MLFPSESRVWRGGRNENWKKGKHLWTACKGWQDSKTCVMYMDVSRVVCACVRARLCASVRSKHREKFMYCVSWSFTSFCSCLCILFCWVILARKLDTMLVCSKREQHTQLHEWWVCVRPAHMELCLESDRRDEINAWHIVCALCLNWDVRNQNVYASIAKKTPTSQE